MPTSASREKAEFQHSHALEHIENNSHMLKVGGHDGCHLGDWVCSEVPAGLLNAAGMRRDSSRSFTVAGPFEGLPELIVRTGPLTKPEALRRGAIVEQKRWLW